MKSSFPSLLQRYVAIFLTVGLVSSLEALLTIEWSFSDCLTQLVDGPVYAPVGIPFPYESQSDASSLAYEFMPHVYLLNLFLLCLWVLPFVHAVLNVRVPFEKKRLRIFLSSLGLFLSCGMLALNFFMISDNVFRPVFSIGDASTRYKEYRPVGLNFKSEVSLCKPLNH